MPIWNRSCLKMARLALLMLCVAAFGHARFASAEPAWSPVTSLGGGIIDLAAATGADARLDVFATGTDTKSDIISQITPGSATWTAWSGLAVPNGLSLGKLATAMNIDGRQEVFTIATNNELYHNWQTTPGGSWSGWVALGGGIIEIATASNLDGRVVLFAIGTNKNLNYVIQTAPGSSTYTSYVDLGGGIVKLATAIDTHGLIQVFAVGTDGNMNQISQLASGGPYSAWIPLGAPPGGGGTDLATAVNRDGRFAVFMTASGGVVSYIEQTGPGSPTWSSWASLGGTINKLATAINADGTVEVIGVGTNNELQHIWQNAPDSTSWSSWTALGSQPVSDLSVAVDGNGRIEAFAIGLDHALYHTSETAPSASGIAVATYHYDNLRTGWNASETQLTPANITSKSLGLLAKVTLDEQVDAQPLIVPHQIIAGQTTEHDVVYVATENNTVYAIDAYTAQVLAPPKNLGVAVPREYLARWQNPYPAGVGCSNNGPKVGIDGTPVIDLASGTLYVIAYTIGVDGNNRPIAGTQSYHLHALDLATLNDKVPPQLVSATHSLNSGNALTFSAIHARQRPGLVEANGNIYAGFGSFCDDENREATDPAHARGWVLGWQAATLAALPSNELTDSDATAADVTNVFLSSVWQSGFGLAADELGYIYFTTGNSDCDWTFNGPSCTLDPPLSMSTYDGVNNIQESVVKLKPNLSAVSDHFTPSNVAGLDLLDNDLSSGGILLLPVQQSTIPHLAVAAGKDGRIFLFDRDALGGFTLGGPDKVLDFEDIGACWCGPSYFSDGATSYIVTSGGTSLWVWVVRMRELVGTSTYANMGPQEQDGGFFTSVSSNGNLDSVIWAVARPQSASDDKVQLFAFQALPPNQGSALTPLPSLPIVAGHWPNTDANANIVPVVANGRAYVASNKELAIFGLCPCSTLTAAVLTAAETSPAQQVDPAYHRISGTIQSVSASQLAIETRAGTVVQVDISAGGIKNAGAALDRKVEVWGTYDTSNILHATTIYRTKPLPALWPPDL
jgi:hypothetical protein